LPSECKHVISVVLKAANCAIFDDPARRRWR
jgi:hypothetical protein